MGLFYLFTENKGIDCLAAQLIFCFILVYANNRFSRDTANLLGRLCVLIIINLNIAVDSQHQYYCNPFYLIK